MIADRSLISIKSKSPERKNSVEWSAQIASKILDGDLKERYGTSLNINMGREYQQYIDQKYQSLKSEFDQIDKDADDIITIEELMVFLNHYSKDTGRQYD